MRSLRPIAGAVMLPFARSLARTPITPNHLTILGLFLTVLVAIYIAYGDPRIAGVLALLAGAFDMLDGSLARLTDRTSRFGAFLDSTLDRVGEAALLAGVSARFAFEQQATGQLVVLAALTGSLMVSYTRARAEGIGVSGESGIFDRPARLVTLALGLMLDLTVPALMIIAVLTMVTVIQRILYVRRQLSS